MTKLHELAHLGQSIWIDYIRRAFIESGELQDRIDAGIRGVTSNPAIFEKAITGSADYDNALRNLSGSGKSTVEIYEALAIEDIQRAADLFHPVFEQSKGTDGFVSLEVNPKLAGDTQATIAEARRLYKMVGRPNVMIKVPATPPGIPAIETLIGEGININVTLMFSLDHYDAVAGAYLRGLERLLAAGGALGRVASVASFFLSRIDSAVDAALEAAGTPNALELKGKIAIANARITYQRYLQTFSGQRWQRLAEQGARVQRVLWASTSTKDPNYPDTMYVDNLIGPGTVNTVPLSTLAAFLDHGTVAISVTQRVAEARAQLARLAGAGINLDAITEQLQLEGVNKFVKPFEALLVAIEQKIRRLEEQKASFTTRLGLYEEAVDAALNDIKDQAIMARIWSHDHTVWKPDPKEITNRLGWLHLPETMPENTGRIQALVDEVKADGYTHVLLLGMGGSSLAPEVFGNTFGHDHEGLVLEVLDSTDPGMVLAYAERLDPARTLFIVSTKSGGTVETLSFFKTFYNLTAAAVGGGNAGSHFVAITDKGSRLDQLASRYNFRATFLNDPNIGGRYSALSYFGLVPAGLVGVDLARLLDSAQTMAANNESCNYPLDGDNMGALLGVIMGELARHGRDKITLITSAGLANFGDWVEQLIAESTGKDNKGIFPVVGETVGAPGVYGDDRLFVHLRLAGDGSQDASVAALAGAGHPVVTLQLDDRYDMGGQFFLWEMATAVAGYRLDIQPFDQPNVEAAKVLARQMVEAYRQHGELPRAETSPVTAEALNDFLSWAEPGDYISLQAYIQPAPETMAALQALRMKLRDKTRLATSLGFGPRFLHSTGQLHKGDDGNGLFIQFTSEKARDVPIPDEAGESDSSISFGVLITAQALGDAQALLDEGRRLIRFHLDGDAAGVISQLAATMD